MGLSFLKKFSKPSNATEGEIDIDVKPMMNVLIILIPFLVSVAEYTQLAVQQLSLPPNVSAGLGGSAGEKPKLKLTVVLTNGYCAITQGETMLDSVPAISGSYNLTILKDRLTVRRDATDVKDEILVAVRDSIAFKHVVDVMDVCRESGFEKSGLTAATENPGEGR